MELLFNKKKNIKNIISSVLNHNESIDYFDKSILIFDDNFLAMSQLLKNYKSKIDLVYIDPPFNTKDIFLVSDERKNTISKEKKGIVAYKDKMNFDDYLNFMYSRFILIRELLSNRGSLYVHIDNDTVHYFKIILDEIFGKENFKNCITRIKSNPKNFDRKAYGNQTDMILFYTKSKDNIWNNVTLPMEDKELFSLYKKIDANGRRYTTIPLHAPGETNINSPTGRPWKSLLPPKGRHWRTNTDELTRLDKEGLIEWSKSGNPRIIKYAENHNGKKIQDVWTYKDPQNPVYPTEKNTQMIDLIIKQSSNADSIIMDCFAGSGTSLLVAANNKRKFIGIDNSEIAINTIKKRLYKNDYIFIDKRRMSKEEKMDWQKNN